MGGHTPANAAGGPITLTLPTTPAAGKMLSVEKTDTSINAVTITGNIRGAAGQSIILSLYRETVGFVSDGSNSWWPVFGHKTLGSLDGRFGKLLHALEAVPLAMVGDSYGQGSQGADQVSRPAYRIAQRHHTQTVANYALAGTRSDQIEAQAFANVAPNSRGAVIVADGCINDSLQYADTTGLATCAESFRAMLAFLTCKAYLTNTSSSVQFGVGWSAGTSSTVGSHVDVAVNGDAAWLLFQYVTGSGGTATVKNSAGTAVTPTVSTGSFKQALIGAVPVSGLGAGAHTLRVAVASGSVTFLGALIPSATPALVVWDKVGALSSSSTNTLLVQYQAAVQAVITAQFASTVLVADMTAAGWDASTMISSEDGIHRNDKGCDFATNVIELAIATYLAGNFRQGINRLSAATADSAYTPASPAYTGPGATAPAAATGVAGVTANQINATWTIGDDGGSTLLSQKIQTSVDAGTTWVDGVTGLSPTAASAAIPSGLTNGSSYLLRVVATNAIGSTASSASSAVTAGVPVANYWVDTFTRSDNTVPGTTETGGFAWTVTSGNAFGIASGALTSTTVGTSPQDCYVDDGHADGTITFTLPLGSGQGGIMFRGSGTNDAIALVFYHDATGAYFLKSRSGGSTYATIQPASGVTAAAGDVIQVVLNGSSIICRVNGVTVITATSAINQTATRHGVWTTSVGVKYKSASHNNSIV